jgi:hypothetical protein
MNDGLAGLVAQMKAKVAALDQTKRKLEAAINLLTQDDKPGTRVAAARRTPRHGNGVVQSTSADDAGTPRLSS